MVRLPKVFSALLVISHDGIAKRGADLDEMKKANAASPWDKPRYDKEKMSDQEGMVHEAALTVLQASHSLEKLYEACTYALEHCNDLDVQEKIREALLSCEPASSQPGDHLC
ncbi:hypothetical protein [Geoalkalibacter subterraneus]|uniref:Uncharacterized protein n=1 Tax=Geoalkalibacter subterraneus TaxID=483547 RepID=A0A0B5FUI2_9BACT|nr:hypothetical protein [Geoalkalibacter subterraneus]AJF08304.1 hypothetical protein GSUB_17685 [Geoalkalibacter subterraneus]